MTKHIGQQIDQYRVKSHLAKGGMADLYLAEDVTLQRPVALNVTDNDQPRTAVQELYLSHVATRLFTDPTSWGTLTLE